MPEADPRRQSAVPTRPGQAAVSLLLFALLASAWVGLHVWSIYRMRWTVASLPLAAVACLAVCWLCVGLFIVAHDTMHGSFAPGRPRLNALVGRVCVTLYAGFDYDRLTTCHHAHHRAPGTADDPDFDPGRPHGALKWYTRFLTRYMSLRQVLFFAAAVNVEAFVFGAPFWRLLVFWALPALASSVQLFWFGTYLPHRDGAAPFPDRHNARSNDYAWLWSLLTCFHFGYHHQHHTHPWLPWWRLSRAVRPSAPAWTS